MSTTLRTPESYLDEVAIEQGKNVNTLNLHYRSDKLVITEAMRRMLEDAFKAQKEICAERAKVIDTFRIVRGTSASIGGIQVDKPSIINAPTPFEIDNQNKN